MEVSGIFTINGKDYTKDISSLPFDSPEIKDLEIDFNSPLVKAIIQTPRSKKNKLRGAFDVIYWESKTRLEQAVATIPSPKTLLGTALATFGFATGNVATGAVGAGGAAAGFNEDVLKNGYGVVDLWLPINKEKEKERRKEIREELFPILQSNINNYGKSSIDKSGFLPTSFLAGTPFEGREVVFYVLLLIFILWLTNRLLNSK